MKQKSTSLAVAMVVAGGVVIAAVAAATGQVPEAHHGATASAPTPHATVALGYQPADSDLVDALGEWGVGRRTPRA
ncbi:hypothetical protein OOK43_33280 [[Kitasatospora] papulosa]|jgi:hypothetical protein|uniref:hypothetical protein n=1 Tax=Streptomyces TaxID=1883 RepID=UPI0002C6C89E|nr:MULTISPECIES: hypothetical protein [Streptomyces]MDF9868036.1 hypothetical protein [Streptomyces pratensis]RAS24384.1 hypothetical protein BCL80_11460 [Streptomyces avidinii]AGJ59404.1 hypothetical protein F750_6980 [Streptomyces sp. PAMC 26508]MCX4418108.1 hypothetical protein [[Kitasatospora] papulosa]WJY35356.1 hypothetical protein QTO28_31825 [Streptomyces sp. P9-2B-1]